MARCKNFFKLIMHDEAIKSHYTVTFCEYKGIFRHAGRFVQICSNTVFVSVDFTISFKTGLHHSVKSTNTMHYPFPFKLKISKKNHFRYFHTHGITVEQEGVLKGLHFKNLC